MSIYRCVIIGCGAIGGGYDRRARARWSFTHAGAYQLSPRTQLVAAADTNKSALARFGRKWGVRELFTDYQQMLEEHQPDIVSLCLPTSLHWQAFRDVCKRNVGAIFCEKPLSENLRQARQMARLAKGRLVTVNYVRRWNPSLVRLRSEIMKQRLGKPKNVVVRYTKGLFGVGSHFVDFARWFWGEPTEVRRLSRVERPGGDPGVDFLLRFRPGPVVYFLHVPDPGYVFLDVDILTDRGRIVIGQRGQEIERSRAVPEPHFQHFRILRRVSTQETAWRDCLPSAVLELVRCLDNGSQPSCTVEDGLRAVEICHKAAGRR